MFKLRLKEVTQCTGCDFFTRCIVHNSVVLKVLKIEEKQFSEVCNLRIREMVNLSYSATDVAWSPLEGFIYCCLIFSVMVLNNTRVHMWFIRNC